MKLPLTWENQQNGPKFIGKCLSPSKVKRWYRGMSRNQFFAIILALASCASGSATASQGVTGIWFDDSGKGAVKLYNCGSTVCGRIFWLRQAQDRNGTPLRDANNPETSRRNRTICGLPVVSGLRLQADGSWDGGRIYDPKVGRTYNVAMERLSRRQIRITGYLGARFLGRSFIWNRAPDTLPPCDR